MLIILVCPISFWSIQVSEVKCLHFCKINFPFDILEWLRVFISLECFQSHVLLRCVYMHFSDCTLMLYSSKNYCSIPWGIWCLKNMYSSTSFETLYYHYITITILLLLCYNPYYYISRQSNPWWKFAERFRYIAPKVFFFCGWGLCCWVLVAAYKLSLVVACGLSRCGVQV